MGLTFYAINGKESRRVEKFNAKHSDHATTRASLTFIQTCIGEKKTVKCQTCGKVKDITDYGTW